MHDFAELVDKLYFLNSNNAKSELLRQYLASTPDPDRGWAIAAIAGTLSFEFFKRRLIKEIISARVDPVLFDLSYDYVGEMSETVAHLWSTTLDSNKPESTKALPSLAEVVTTFQSLPKNRVSNYLIELLDAMTPTQRWALLKLGTKGLRIGISARFLKKILAQYAQTHHQDIHIEDIERVWHGVSPPYEDLLAYLEGKAPAPDVSTKLTFQPVMLAHSIDEQNLDSIHPSQWQAEWKFDGIRAQLVSNSNGIALFSRTGDDISHSFPDFIHNVEHSAMYGRFDGELVALTESAGSDLPLNLDLQRISSFNQLQQRLNKKKPSKKLMQNIPVGMLMYDALFIETEDIRDFPLQVRSAQLEAYLCGKPSAVMAHSQHLNFSNSHDLLQLKKQASTMSNGYIEGLMLKAKQSLYVAGRPKGQWYKLKRDPQVIDAVLMYAQRGHGKRSSFYSDFTFGCWQNNVLLPIGKAYSGFTDEELKKLDNWVRRNTIARFGPVKEVNKDLVFEIAFDAVHSSNRHKSKVALRFPRIHRIRWDKPAPEADQLQTLIDMI